MMLQLVIPKLGAPEIGLPVVQTLLMDWGAAVPLFVILLLAGEVLLQTSEWITARRNGEKRRLLSDDFIVNLLTTSVYNLTIRAVGLVAVFGAGMAAYHWSHWRVPLNWWTLVPYFLMADLWLYLFHRLMHEVRIFWADHTVHHSSEQYDFSTFERRQWLEWIPKIVVIMPLAMLGFHPAILLLFGTLASIQIIVHTSRFGRWGWWDYVIISPATHAVHHARNPLYMDRNHGGVTYLWDHIFGTYQNVTGEKLIYGVTHTVRSNNVLKVFFWEYSFVWRDLVAAPTLKDKVIVLFGRPGETFEAPPKTSKIGQEEARGDGGAKEHAGLELAA